MPTLPVPLRDMIMEQVDADRLVLSGGHVESNPNDGRNNEAANADIYMFTRSSAGDLIS